ncbi:MAG: NUDIX domain-containing protein [Candidatus Cyclobacteriaceae bacterium M3_2C_046]
MQKEKKELEQLYGNKLRVRVMGLFIQNGQLLMVKHRSVGTGGYLWLPPGGGMHFGCSSEDNLNREFEEETGLSIKIERFLFVHEYLNVPLHAIELFFSVEKISGSLIRGIDPEMKDQPQIIEEVRFMSETALKKIHPENKHNIFNHCENFQELLNLQGYYKLEN